MRNIDVWLNKYAESHQNPLNKLIHWFCVPAITFTLLGLLAMVEFSFKTNNQSLYNINLSYILIIFAIIFYARLSFPLTIGMIIFTGFCIFIIENIANIFSKQELLSIYISIFIIAWIGQFIGHKIEGKKPSFFEDIKFLLIGPAWLLSFIYNKLNIKI